MRFARHSREWAPPPEFDGFRVRGPLGEGGMGTVYRADDVALDRPVALKFVRENGDPRAHERFVIEARALARLVHPNVVQVYRVGEVEGRAYLAYELVEGRSLAATTGPVEWAFALDLGIGIARGLAAVHARGLLHRDLKPSNVVVTPLGEPKLIDFGLARAIDADLEATPSWADDPTAPAGLTTIGRIVGTPQYMAPELFRGEPATVRSDVYSVGLLLHELLSGVQLRVGRRLGEIAVEALDRDVPPIERSDVPRGLADVVAGCVRRDPALRCRSAEELRESLELVRSYYRPFTEAATGRDAHAQSERVAASFARLAAGGDRLVVRFYELLFALDPRQRRLFPADLSGQRRKLMHQMEVIVGQLRAPERLVPMLEDLGRRHVGYGVTPEHVELSHRALLSAVRDLDPELDEATELAWITALDRLRDAFRRGLTFGSAQGAHTIPPTAGSIDAREIEVPVTRYVDRDGVTIAYQTLGEGALDLVVVPGLVSHLELAWGHPASASLLRGIAGLGRLVVLDKRGTGLSERMVHSRSLEDHAGDLVAVMDAIGSERAVLIGAGDGAAVVLVAAALHPSRVRALALHAPIALPGALPRSEGLITEVRRRWGGPVLLDTIAPSLHGEASFRDLWASTLRTGSSPAALVAMLGRAAAVDLGALLPFVAAPALVLHRRDDRLVPLEAGRALATRLATSPVVLDGVDHLPAGGAAGRWIDALEDALGVLEPGASAARRGPVLEVWATIAGGDAAAHGALQAAGGRAREGAFVLPSPRAAIDAARAALRAGARGVVISAQREDVGAIEPGIVLVDPIGELVLAADLDLTPIPDASPRRWRLG